MNHKEIYFYIAAALALIIQVPGRFAFGLVMLILFNVQILSGVLFGHLIAFLKLEDLKNVLIATELIAITIFFKQILIVLTPICALTLGFVLYLPAFSSAIIEFSYRDDFLPLYEDVTKKGLRSGIFSAIALAFFLLRDIVGYGTLTLPGRYTLVTLQLPIFSYTAAAGAFLATIPGAFLLVAIVLLGYLFVNGQFKKIECSAEA